MDSKEDAVNTGLKARATAIESKITEKGTSRTAKSFFNVGKIECLSMRSMRVTQIIIIFHFLGGIHAKGTGLLGENAYRLASYNNNNNCADKKAWSSVAIADAR